MRNVSGRQVRVGDHFLYVEESGHGNDWVVLEAGGGCGRTCWDPLVPALAESARVLAYDRAGRARSGPATRQGIDGMAADLVAMTETIVPGQFVLVAHSMGGLVARRAAERLGSRLRGLLLVDPTPESSPVYDTWDQTTKNIDRVLALMQTLSRVRPLAPLLGGNVRRFFSADTYRAMLEENVTPAGISQTRKEMRAVAVAIHEFRANPPQVPTCPTVVLSAGRPEKRRERQNALAREHQRRFADSLPDGRHEIVDSGHLMMAEQPQLLATRTRQLLDATK